MPNLISTLNTIQNAPSETELRKLYDQACADHAGDDAALFAVCECTCAMKERFEDFEREHGQPFPMVQSC